MSLNSLCHLRAFTLTALLICISSKFSYAGGFSLYTESSVDAVGNYAAGVAAEAMDASTGWYNPAGLALLHKQQAIIGAVGVLPSSVISGTSNFNVRSVFGLANYSQSFNGLDGAEKAAVPSLHYALPLGPHTTFGISVVSPFGLSTDWGTRSPVRYQATFTELITTNISPQLGAQLLEHVQVGLGFDFQWARVTFNRILGLPNIFSILPPFDPMRVDTLSYNRGTSFGIGFHAGLLGNFNEDNTRVGINYQSKMRHVFYGYSELRGVLANNIPSLAEETLPGEGVFRFNGLSSNPVELPDIVTLSAYQNISDHAALLGSVVYTGWSTFKTIQLNNVVAPAINPMTFGVTQVLVNSPSAQNYRNTWRFALGANYQLNPLVMLRLGGGYDQTPTNDTDRDVRLPDVDRWALSVGAHWQALYNLGMDIGYTHLFGAHTSPINRTDALGATSSYNVSATATAHANLVGLQLVWDIDAVKEVATK